MKNKEFAGWISKKHGVAWKVNKFRRDKRTGVVSMSKSKSK